VALIARELALLDDRVGRAALAESGEDGVEQIADAVLRGRAEVDALTEALRLVDRRHPGLPDVVDVDEIAGLRAVAVQRDRLLREDVGDEDTDDALVRIFEALPRSVDVEHAEGGHVQRRLQIFARGRVVNGKLT
jgi:hypothetical protein